MEMFYLMTHLTHFIYSYFYVQPMAKDQSYKQERKPAVTTTWATLWETAYHKSLAVNQTE